MSYSIHAYTSIIYTYIPGRILIVVGINSRKQWWEENKRTSNTELKLPQSYVVNRYHRMICTDFLYLL